MATSVLANPPSTGALTGNQFESRWENPSASAAPPSEPNEHEISFFDRANRYRWVVKAPQATIPDWVIPTIAALIGIQKLADNWDSYGGKAVDPDLIRQSLHILVTIMRLESPAPSVVPMGDGGLQIEWHRRQQDLEITFAADEPPQYFHRNKATGAINEGPVRDRELEKLIGFVKGLI